MFKGVNKEVRRINLIFPLCIASALLLSLVGLTELPMPMWLQILISNASFAIPMVIYLFFIERSAREKARIRKVRISTVLLCILTYFCLLPVLSFFNLFSMLYAENAVAETVLTLADGTPFILAVAVIAFAPAVLEELTYRGGFYNTYRKYNPLGAIFLSGILFGLAHMNLNQFTYACVLGWAFALIDEATDSLLPSMIIHFLTNMGTVVLLYGLPAVISYMSSMYDSAIAVGDTETKELIESFFYALGSENVSESALDSLFTGAELTSADIISLLPSYGFKALVGGALAFLLFKTIAKRSGRWEHIISIFRRKTADEKYGSETAVRVFGFSHAESAGGSVFNINEEDGQMEDMTGSCTQLISMSLIAGIIICLAEMALVFIVPYL